MTPGFQPAISTLENSFQATRQRWLAARALWLDQSAQHFEQTYWQIIEDAALATPAQLRLLADVVAQARHHVK
jgi:hypothetical protein